MSAGAVNKPMYILLRIELYKIYPPQNTGTAYKTDPAYAKIKFYRFSPNDCSKKFTYSSAVI